MSVKRIPSLDGIRCIAVAMVFISHCAGTRFFPPHNGLGQLFSVGNLGVRIFFVLSGFLITFLMLKEAEKYGKVSIKNFYIRRTIRIFPALYFFVICMAVGNAVGWIDLTKIDLFHAFSYTMNYHFDRGWEVGQLWSLAVEEQFYLLWPMALALLGTRRGMWLSVLVIGFAPVCRVLTWIYIPSQHAGIGQTFQTVCDALATGCLLAGIRFFYGDSSIFSRVIKGIWVPLLVIAVFLLNYYRGHISISFTFGETLMNLFIAMLIDWSIRNHESFVGRFLNSPPLVHVGALSYSLYLWQQPFMNKESESLLCSFPVNIFVAILLACLSYHFVEKPFLCLRSKFQTGDSLNIIENATVIKGGIGGAG